MKKADAVSFSPRCARGRLGERRCVRGCAVPCGHGDALLSDCCSSGGHLEEEPLGKAQQVRGYGLTKTLLRIDRRPMRREAGACLRTRSTRRHHIALSPALCVFRSLFANDHEAEGEAYLGRKIISKQEEQAWAAATPCSAEPVTKYMATNIITLTSDTSLAEAGRILSKRARAADELT